MAHDSIPSTIEIALKEVFGDKDDPEMLKPLNGVLASAMVACNRTRSGRMRYSNLVFV